MWMRFAIISTRVIRSSTWNRSPRRAVSKIRKKRLTLAQVSKKLLEFLASKIPKPAAASTAIVSTTSEAVPAVAFSAQWIGYTQRKLLELMPHRIVISAVLEYVAPQTECTTPGVMLRSVVDPGLYIPRSGYTVMCRIMSPPKRAAARADSAL